MPELVLVRVIQQTLLKSSWGHYLWLVSMALHAYWSSVSSIWWAHWTTYLGAPPCQCSHCSGQRPPHNICHRAQSSQSSQLGMGNRFLLLIWGQFTTHMTLSHCLWDLCVHPWPIDDSTAEIQCCLNSKMWGMGLLYHFGPHVLWNDDTCASEQQAIRARLDKGNNLVLLQVSLACHWATLSFAVCCLILHSRSSLTERPLALSSCSSSSVMPSSMPNG